MGMSLCKSRARQRRRPSEEGRYIDMNSDTTSSVATPVVECRSCVKIVPERDLSVPWAKLIAVASMDAVLSGRLMNCWFERQPGMRVCIVFASAG